ncbi:DUF932 domain-containing protein [Curtobacterium sp. PsM8]|uniref:DUF932 domain-containing protein n=1 Tax=Curtobacterium sp. PsM8 TaxID=3030532 RepID=UPI00263AABA8|nr:DUF932 domain-containing protein [Curtobacterium sp. PsM8]MDN4648147.1 DUF932 domain-containing protein [Curtobacterium sp. PsM8]
MGVGTRSHVSVRHTSGAIYALAQAHESLNAVPRYASAFEKASEPLLTKQYVDDEFSRIIERLLAVKSEENPYVSAILSLRHGSSTIDDAFRGSAWSAYQSFTEYADHFMPVRFAGDAATGRAMRSIGPAMPRAKSRLFQALIEA